MQSSQPPPYRGQGQRRPDLFTEKGREEIVDLMMPRTVVSLAIWILMFALGAGLSGLIFFAIYQGQLNGVEERLIKSQEELSRKVDQKLQQSGSAAEGSSEFKSSSVRPSAEDESRAILQELLGIVGPSLAVIEGVDAAGAPTVGSGFVINNTGDEAWVLTNHHLVEGAIGEFKTVRVRLSGTQLQSEVYSADPSRDLALIIYKGGGARALRFVSEPPKPGEPVWAAGTAKGTSGSAISGVLKEVTAVSMVTDVVAPAHYSGGPLLNRDGRVLGVLSIKPPVSGTDPSANVAVPIELACVEVVRCPQKSASPSPSPSPRSTVRPSPTGRVQTPSPPPQPDGGAEAPPG
jgi:S1-C subfamily serine protease